MRSLGKIFLFILLVLLGGALAAPLAWQLIHRLPAGLWSGHVGQIQSMPFHRYFSRCLQVFALLLLWPLLRSLQIRSMREFGLTSNPRPFLDAGVGLLTGIFCALLLQPLLIVSGAFALDSGWSSVIVPALPRLVLTAALVATLEEFLFRGVLLGFFRQFTGPVTAIFLSAAVFAGIHFLNLSPAASDSIPPRWWSGLAMTASLGSNLPPLSILAWAFGTLFCSGVILAWITVRTGSLWAAIGLHGSWILGQQIFNAVAGFQVHPQGEMLPLFGPSQCNGMVPVGLVPMACLLFSGFFVSLLLRRREQPPVFPTSGR